MRELEVCREAVRLGSDVVSRYYRDGVTMRSKEPYNLVSDADVEAEQCIGEFIHRNFAHHVPHFAVSVAYYCRGQPVCGVVANPVRDDWYEAARGEGAFHNGNRVHVGSQESLDQILVGVGFYYDRGAMMEATLDAIRELFGRDIHGIRRFGTASLDLCQVGAGSLGVFFEYQLSPWDFAAGRLFVEEAGGRVTTCRGEALPLEKTSLLASNSHLHDSALEIVQRHLLD